MNNISIKLATNLSSQQSAIIDWALDARRYDKERNLNLVARAGCGKTYTLVELIKALVGQARAAARQSSIILVAFNKGIADEATQRLVSAGIDWKEARASTLHAVGFNAWKRAAPKCDKPDEYKVPNIVKQMWTENSTPGLNATAIAKLVSYAKQSGAGIVFDMNDQDEWLALCDHFSLDDDLTEDATTNDLSFWAKQVLEKSISLDYDVIDFDDMLFAPLYHNVRFWQYDWVLIDEAQDTNAVRREMAMRLRRPRGRIVAVGDDRQAIYGFTGADSDAMDLIRNELGSIVLPLNVTYRCASKVVEFAQQFVPDIYAAPGAKDGEVIQAPSWWMNETRDEDPDTMAALPGFHWTDLKPGQDAILCRNTKPLIECAFSLIRRGVPVRVLGRDIGKGLERLATKWKLSSLSALDTKLQAYLAREVAKWTKRNKPDKVAAITDKVETLRVLVEATTKAGGRTVVDLVSRIKSLFGEADDDRQPPAVILSTVHKAKGLEWLRVIILGWTEYMPSKWARLDHQIRQEENLQYVAATRAIDTLVLA